jgi:hypothetical protein
LPAFEDVLIAVIVTESFAFVATNEWVRTAVADSPSVIESVAASIVSEFAITVAEDGATESIPNPNAATATSAMRLIDVVVDICFLSISRTEEFPQFGLNQISLIRFDESHVLIHQIPHRVSGRGEETYLFVFHLHSLR